jgi:hypothetical protein
MVQALAGHVVARVTARDVPLLISAVVRWADAAKGRRVELQAGSFRAVVNTGDPKPRVPEVVDTPSGPILRYAVDSANFVLVDSNGGHVVSWTGICQAADFLSVCKVLTQQSDSISAVIAVDGKRIAGRATAVLTEAGRLGVDVVNATCDFVRFDTQAIDIAYHRFPSPGLSRPVISAVSDEPYGALLRQFLDATTTTPVAKVVVDVAPLGESWREHDRVDRAQFNNLVQNMTVHVANSWHHESGAMK